MDHHSIPFTFRDHLHACLNCFPSLSVCFPSSASSSSRRLFNSSSSDTSFSDHDDLPRNRETLLSNGNLSDEHDEDIAAWGSDALSLRSKAGRGGTSRMANLRKSKMGWVWGLFAGRRKHHNTQDGLEDVEAEEEEEEGILGAWGGEGDWDELPAPRERRAELDEDVQPARDFDLGGISDFDDDPEAAVEGEGGWGAFLSAPLSSARSTRSRSPSPSPPSLLPPDLTHTHTLSLLNHQNLSIDISHPSPTPFLSTAPSSASVNLPLPSSLFPSSEPNIPASTSPRPLPPIQSITLTHPEDKEDPADLGSEYFRPKANSTRRSYTNAGSSASSSTSATGRTAATGNTVSSTRSSSRSDGGGKIAGGQEAAVSAGNRDPDSTPPSPSNLYGSPNPFSFPATASPPASDHDDESQEYKAELERKRKAEKKERKKARKERKAAKEE